MANVLIAACPPIGHVGPLLNVARGLVNRGDDVTFLTAGRHADAIRATGARPRPLPHAADYGGSTFDTDFPGRTETSGVARVDFDVTHVFVRPMPHQAAVLDDLLRERHFDALVVDALFLGVLPMLLGDPAERPPVLTYSTTPLFLSSRDTAPGGTGIPPLHGPLGRWRNRALHLLAQKVLLRGSHQASQTMLKALGAPRLPVFVLDSAVLADRLIVPTIPEFEYHRGDLPEHVRFVGAVNPEPAERFTAPRWWDRLSDGRPVVHVTQGTIDNADLSRLIEPTITALADEDVTLVVSTGGRDVNQIRTPIPANTIVTEYIPHDVLLPMVDVMITNGGYGAVQRALTAGVPLVVAGDTEDKPEVAARVEYFGAGLNLGTGTPNARMVRGAVQRILGDERYLRRARELESDFARRDGIAEIALLIDEVIDEVGGRHHAGSTSSSHWRNSCTAF